MNNSTSVCDTIFKKITQICINYRSPFLSALCCGLLSYVYAFTNKFINHDEIVNLFGKGATYDSGRWGLNIVSLVFPNYSMPWIYGIISVVLISISACLIVKVFHIDNIVFQILISALIITFPSLCGTFIFMFTSSSYSLAFFLAILGTYYCETGRKNKRIIIVIAGLISIIASLSIYQAYIALVASIFIILCIQEVLSENTNCKQILIQGVQYVVFLGISLIIYFCITKVILLFLGTGFNGYANAYLHSSERLLVKIFNAYYAFFRELFFSSYSLVPNAFSRIIHFVLLLVMAIEGVYCLVKTTNPGKRFLFILLCALFPFSVNCMFVITDSSAVHTLVLYGFVSFYLLSFVLHIQFETIAKSNNLKFFGRDVLMTSFAIVCCINILFSNTAYLQLELIYQNTFSFYSSLVTEIKSTPGFNEDSKIAIIGQTHNNWYSFDEFQTTKSLAGIDKFDYINLSNETKQRFIKYYLGFDVPFATKSEIEILTSTPEVAEMSSYPYYGSVKAFDNYIIIKFSE